MKSSNVWGDRLKPPFRAVGDHIGVELPGGRAMFFTRRGGVSGEPFEELNVGLDTNDYMPAVEENRERVAQLIGIPRERWLESKQVHGSHVRVVTELPEPGSDPVDADGVATTLEDVAAVVVTADCLPVALIAPEGVAMIHAGWRGLSTDVLKKGVDRHCATPAPARSRPRSGRASASAATRSTRGCIARSCAIRAASRGSATTRT